MKTSDTIKIIAENNALRAEKRLAKFFDQTVLALLSVLFVILLAALAGCAPVTPKWGGLHLGPAIVSGYKSCPDERNVSMELNAIWLIPGGTMQLEAIQPVTDAEGTLFRAAINWRIDKFFTSLLK